MKGVGLSLPRRLADSRYAHQIMSILTPEVDQLVWHYTNAAGALGIINGQEIWASSVPFLNDSAEIWHGLTLIEDAARERQQFHGFTARILAHARSQQAFDLLDSYVLSASMNESSYPHFVEYGQYAIGFNPGMSLTKAVRDNPDASSPPLHPGFETGWRRVLYERDEKRQQAERLLSALEEIEDLRGTSDPDGEGHLAAIECVVRTAAHMKDELFRHEHEVRLYGRARRTDAEVSYRARGEMVVPYIKIMADQDHPSRSGRLLPLMGVGLGPGLDAKSAKIGLDALLRSKGYDWISVEDRSGSHR